MKPLNVLSMTLVAILLAACGASDKSNENPAAALPPPPAPAKLMQDQREAMEKAKGVENTVQQQAQEQQQAADRQTQ